MIRLSSVLVAVALAAGAGPVAAQPPTTTPAQRAKQLYDVGTRHYNLGEYGAAIDAYKDAYRELPEPYFLYNIAQAYRLAHDDEQALAFYKSFLNALPDAANRAEVEARIAELTASLAQQAATHAAAPTGAVPPDGLDRPPPTVPTPAEAVARRHAAPAVSAAPPPVVPVASDRAPRPVYRAWWFWVGVGAVAAGAATLAVVATSADDAPASDLGNFPVFR